MFCDIQFLTSIERQKECTNSLMVSPLNFLRISLTVPSPTTLYSTFQSSTPTQVQKLYWGSFLKGATCPRSLNYSSTKLVAQNNPSESPNPSLVPTIHSHNKSSLLKTFLTTGQVKPTEAKDTDTLVNCSSGTVMTEVSSPGSPS